MLMNTHETISEVSNTVIPVYPESFFFKEGKQKDSRQAGMTPVEENIFPI
jgi:hypothetical protein